MVEATESNTFEHGAGFIAGEVAGALGLGPLEAQYQELFAEALADGVITLEERTRLERAADNLGLDRQRLLSLEQAMLAAYEMHHKVRIVEHYEEAPASLAPIQVEAAGDAGRILLQRRVEQLERRVRELEAELRRAQAAVNVEVDLTDVESAAATASEDPDACWRRVRRDPSRAESYRDLYRIYAARGEHDQQWCAAQCLACLGAARSDELSFFERHRRRTLIAPRTGIAPATFHERLFHPEEELLTGRIFGVIAPAVLLGRVTALRRDGNLYTPAPETRQAADATTITAVRALRWAATLLGLPLPPVHVEKERDVGYEHIPAIPPLTVVGRRALSGRSPLEYAFLVGRHLSYYRAEHFIKTLFSAVQDLEDLFLAALVIGSPRLPIAEDTRRRVEPIARAIEPMLQSEQLDALRASFLRFVEEGGRTNLQRWSRATDKTACRIGLLLCGDLQIARDVLQAEDERGADELVKDLLTFAVSERYFELRRELGITIDAS